MQTDAQQFFFVSFFFQNFVVCVVEPYYYHGIIFLLNLVFVFEFRWNFRFHEQNDENNKKNVFFRFVKKRLLSNYVYEYI